MTPHSDRSLIRTSLSQPEVDLNSAHAQRESGCGSSLSLRCLGRRWPWLIWKWSECKSLVYGSWNCPDRTVQTLAWNANSISARNTSHEWIHFNHSFGNDKLFLLPISPKKTVPCTNVVAVVHLHQSNANWLKICLSHASGVSRLFWFLLAAIHMLRSAQTLVCSREKEARKYFLLLMNRCH